MLLWTWCEAPICCLVQTGREGSQDGVSILSPPPLDGHIPCRHSPSWGFDDFPLFFFFKLLYAESVKGATVRPYSSAKNF